METPIASCLVVTQPGRLPMLAESFACFERQTYPAREFVVVHDGGADFGREIAAACPGATVREMPAGLTLGELRNAAVDASSGEILCHWDDDDLYGPDRLKMQVEPILSGVRATFLAGFMHLFEASRDLHICYGNPVPNTLTCRREILKRNRYAATRKAEDSQMMSNVLVGGKWFIVPRFDLFLYRFHGANTWDETHHRNQFAVPWDVKRHEAMIRDALASMQVSGVKVRNRDGSEAFTVD